MELVETVELPPLGLYKVSLIDNEVSVYPWKKTNIEDEEINLLEKVITSNINWENSIEPKWLDITQDAKVCLKLILTI